MPHACVRFICHVCTCVSERAIQGSTWRSDACKSAAPPAPSSPRAAVRAGMPSPTAACSLPLVGCLMPTGFLTMRSAGIRGVSTCSRYSSSALRLAGTGGCDASGAELKLCRDSWPPPTEVHRLLRKTLRQMPWWVPARFSAAAFSVDRRLQPLQIPLISSSSDSSCEVIRYPIRRARASGVRSGDLSLKCAASLFLERTPGRAQRRCRSMCAVRGQKLQFEQCRYSPNFFTAFTESSSWAVVV